MSAPLRLHLVSHTHWDREWYLPAGRFRQRLVALVDELLDVPPSDGSAFLLDGQAIVLEDYLAVRPERASEVAALLRAGRLEAGPWYVLADELIPGAESLVRNLLAGRRALASLRASSPRVLYCPDSFGHPAALPELACGFGLGTVILWRGYGGARWPQGDSAWWRAPSGARVLLHHLPRDGYEYGSHLPLDLESAAARWSRIRAELGSRSTLGVGLLPHGADHHARQDGWREAIALLGRTARPDEVRASSLGAFVAELEDRAAHATLPEIAGELRDSYGYTWTLQGTFASRAHQKRRNAAAERLLVREAEPWAAIARLAGASARRALLDAAWRALLQCHPHDTLCGCSTDDVARAMDARLDDAVAQGEGVRDDALLDLVGHDVVRARSRPEAWREVMLVRNSCPRPRGGVAVVEEVRKIRDVPVGPGSTVAPAGDGETLQPTDFTTPAIQHLASRIAYERIESPRHYPDNDLVHVMRMIRWVPEVPAYGVSVLRAMPVPGPPQELLVHGDDAGIGGSALRLRSHEGGRLSLESGGRVVGSLVALESLADAGDLYTPSPRPPLGQVRWRETSLVHSGPLRAALAQRWSVERVEGDVDLRLTWSVDAGARFLRIAVDGVNAARDHRLRLVLDTGVGEPRVWADAAFGAVERLPIVVPAEDSRAETPPATAPLHRYVSLFGDAGGATLFSDGLAEHEVMPDGRIAVTLVRAVGELSRSDIPERPGHAGWPTPTPEAQCLGPFRAELALMFHGGTRDAATVDLIERTADDVLLPLTGRTLRSAIVVHDAAGIALEGKGLAFSALKESADGDWIVLRCVNLLDEPVRGAWHLPVEVTEAQLSRLDETPLQPLSLADDVVRFEAAPRAVVTVLVR